MSAPDFRAIHLDDVERIDATGHGLWRPVRRALGVTAFGISGATADAAGDPVVEPHDESGSGSGGHEELYAVMTGAARFTIGGETLEAPAGTLVLIQPGVHREAVATADDTTILIVGGRPGAAMPPSPFEFWFAAEPYYKAGDYAQAIAVLSEGLADHPGHPRIHYQLACFRALAGDREGALADLRIAVDADPTIGAWAAGDEDLDAIRDDPRFPA